MRRALWLTLAVTLISACTTDSRDSQSEPPPYTADIRWTSHGIPHIRAFDWHGAGFGLAYAVASDAICVLAEEFATVRGERALYFGSENANIDSDVFHRALLNDARIDQFLAARSDEATGLLTGYVAGYNRFIRDQRSNLSADCEGLGWVKEINVRDVARLNLGVGIRYGLGRVIAPIANASPASENDVAIVAAANDDVDGSNALAFGRTLTTHGRGILLGNPHYPWHGASRFHLAHITIPGELDVMGVGLITTPLVSIGFTRNVAWTHTVSTALRFTLVRFSLDPTSRLRYRAGNRWHEIETREVSVQVRHDDGRYTTETRNVYMTHQGPVVSTRDTPWGPRYVYAMRDVNYENDRGTDQYLDIARAANTNELEAALARHQGVAFVNTIAADRDGNAFYGDVSAIPYVTTEQIERCRVEPERIGGRRVITLDGSRANCKWQQSNEAAASGLMPPSQMPSLQTDTWVNNANDSHWLSNPEKRLEGFSPIIGDEGTPRSLRTRAGLVFVKEVLDRGPVSADDVQALLFSHRHYGAELLLDDILAICDDSATTLDVVAACSILADWDRRQDVDSRGAQIYNEMWNAAGREIMERLIIAFDPEDPANTPRALDTDDIETRDIVMRGIQSALAELGEANILPMARWGDVQFAERGGERIGIPGGSGGAGMYSVITARLNKDAGGYTPIRHGNSYVQVVTWSEDGSPDARAILTYSQSPQPESRWYADQTRLYSESEWIRLPFTEREIEADMIQRLQLTEQRP